MMQKAKACRMHTPCVPRTFKQALACRTQHHPMLTAEEIADRAEVQVRRLHRWANDNEPHEQISAQALIRICAVTGAWDLLDFLVEPHGLRVVSTNRTEARSLVNEAMESAAASGRLMEVVHRAVSDGRVDDEEMREIRQHTRIVRREMDDIDSVLDKQVRTA